jgi:Tfp pilus assembly protein PilN
MSEFRISPVTQRKERAKSCFFHWFLVAVVIVEAVAGGYGFFRIDAQITELQQQIESLQQKNKGEDYDV